MSSERTPIEKITQDAATVYKTAVAEGLPLTVAAELSRSYLQSAFFQFVADQAGKPRKEPWE
jgi:hypothetical protein